MNGHPMVGTWQFDIELRQPGTDLAIFVFEDDGRFVAFGQHGWIGPGTWRATGERTAELFYMVESVQPQDVFAPDFVPVLDVFEPGMIAIRTFLEVDSTGNMVTAEGSGTIYRTDGTVAQEFSGDNARMAGTRMAPVPLPAATPVP